MSAAAIIKTLYAHNITLSLSGDTIAMHNGNDTARMYIAAHRKGILNLLRVKQRGEHDGQCSKSACATLATVDAMATGAHLYAAPDDQRAYAEGFAIGRADGVAILTVDEARQTCHSTPCQKWKDAGNAAIKGGASELVATTKAAQVCRECEGGGE